MAGIQIGQVLLEQFRVDAFIAAGGMGAVYKVWDLKRQVPLAMKVLHADLAEDPSIFKRFKREANALKKLAHPNIVPFYGLYETLDFAFLLEGYVDGPTLKEVLKRKGRLSVEEALTVLKGVSAALTYAHAHGVVHCDVKPGNVMIDRGGRVYLTDFGIARHAESMTTTFGFAGTAAYMAPEQIRGEVVTPATDVYALGVMAYELLVGRRPFTGEEEGTAGTATRAERLRMAHLKLAPPDPRQFNAELPEEVAQVLLKALAKEPEERYADAWAFFNALCSAFGVQPEDVGNRLVLDAEVLHQQYTMVTVTPERPFGDPEIAPTLEASQQKSRRSPMPWVVTGLLLVLVVMGSKWLFARDTTVMPTEGVPTVSSTTVQGEHGASVSMATSLTWTLQPTRSSSFMPGPTYTPKPTNTLRPTYTPRPTNTPAPRSVWQDLGYDLAFASDRQNSDFQVYLFNTRTGNAKRLSAPGKRAWWPSFCGNSVAAEVFGGKQWIYLLDPFGGAEAINLSIGASALGVPRCSPDGNRMAYSVKLGVWALVVADRFGNVLFEDDASRLAGFATWERSGRGLYYNRYEEQKRGFSLYYLDLDTGDNFKVSIDNADGHAITSAKYPALSPDGKYLAFVCWINGQAVYLCLAEIGGHSATRLHPLEGMKVNDTLIPLGTPIWSPDGRWIYFTSAEGGDWDIYRIRPDGSGVSAVTTWGSNEIMPAAPWEP